ncbi:uncharacterized protein LOC100205633 isoform X1 [Hydra vulgaris]|uniref:uncharacterized protein LOC100205633 isoform X1 n=1 Tax=Hydra vulgaris TaxID=6087 RepID=UPI000640F068|nr:zinc homeostasis factor 1 [Hydra vulgaris]
MLQSPITDGIYDKKKFTNRWQLKFIAMILCTAFLFILKIVVGYLSNSMALVADSFHMITDFAALIIGFIALRIANKENNNDFRFSEFTFGWVRVEVLGGMINTVFLLALCFSIFITSLKRFVQPEDVSNPKPVLVVGIVSLVINFIGLFLFETSKEAIFRKFFAKKKRTKDSLENVSLMKKNKTDEKIKNESVQGKEPTWAAEYQSPHTLNIRGVYLHILEHFLSSLIVIISAIFVIYFKHSFTKYIDPIFTVMLVFLILHSTIPLFRETLILFMQSVPANLKVKDLEERLMNKICSVLSIHEFHIWALGDGQVVASAHILFETPEEYESSRQAVKTFFLNEGITCMTFQPEFLPVDTVISSDILKQCFNKCNKENCLESMCCDTMNNANPNCSNVLSKTIETDSQGNDISVRIASSSSKTDLHLPNENNILN